MDDLSTEPSESEIIGGGSTARVEREHGKPDQVVKVQYPDCPDPELTRCELQREFDIYQSLPAHHPRLLELLPGSTPERLLLPYLPDGTLHARLDNLDTPLTGRQRLQFAADAAEAVAVLHQHSVFHGDIQLRNFMLAGDRLCIIDFAGSTFHGSPGTAVESTRYFLPRPIEQPLSVRTDLFALGSVLYAICSEQRKAPYHDKVEDEVSQLFTKEVFPVVKHLVCGDIILRCWKGSCNSAKEIFECIAALLEQ